MVRRFEEMKFSPGAKKSLFKAKRLKDKQGTGIQLGIQRVMKASEGQELEDAKRTGARPKLRTNSIRD